MCNKAEQKQAIMARPREDILELDKYLNKGVRVRFQGGREVMGTLKGFDQQANLVLSEAIEFLRDPNNPDVLTEKTRSVGVVVCRSTAVMLICPSEGVEEIQNPWMAQTEEEGTVLPGAEETEEEE